MAFLRRDTFTGVSIHAPARGATAPPPKSRTKHEFQSTRPRGARRPEVNFFGDHEMFQSTRPRGARLDVRERLKVVGVVSIHAPARGATQRKELDWTCK